MTGGVRLPVGARGETRAARQRPHSGRGPSLACTITGAVAWNVEGRRSGARNEPQGGKLGA